MSSVDIPAWGQELETTCESLVIKISTEKFLMCLKEEDSRDSIYINWHRQALRHNFSISSAFFFQKYKVVRIMWNHININSTHLLDTGHQQVIHWDEVFYICYFLSHNSLLELMTSLAFEGWKRGGNNQVAELGLWLQSTWLPSSCKGLTPCSTLHACWRSLIILIAEWM